MLDGPPGKAIGVNLVDCLLIDKIPVGQDDDLDVGDAIPAQLPKRQVNGFIDEP